MPLKGREQTGVKMAPRNLGYDNHKSEPIEEYKENAE